LKRIMVFRHLDIETLGLWEEVLVEHNIEYKYFDTYKEEFPEDNSNFSHLIVLGGPQSVNEIEKYGFIKRELETLENFMKTEKPVLGVGLGAQMIAKVLGSKVYKSVPEIGWIEVNMTRYALIDYLFSHFPRSLRVFTWHEETFDLPAGALRLAYSEWVPNQAFVYRNNVYALQFHLEMTPTMLIRWRNFYKTQNIRKPSIEGLPGFVPDGMYLPSSWEFFKRFITIPRGGKNEEDRSGDKTL